MASNRRFVVRHPVVVAIGCNCTKSKIPSFLSNFLRGFKPKFKQSKILRNRTSSSSFNATTSPSYGYSASESSIIKPNERKKSEKGKQKAEEGVAVAMESADPYVDFLDSMLEMIIEMEIYAWNDLCNLLHRFLALNSSCNQQYILRAFAEIWTEVFSPSASTSAQYW